MKYVILLTLVLVAIGCDSSETTTPPVNTGFTISSPDGFLVGGGRWFDGADTGTYYDAYANFTLKNTLDAWQEVTYTYSFGLLSGKEIINDDAKLVSRSGYRFSKTVSLAPLSTMNIHDTLLIDMGRKQSNDWTLPYGYALAVQSGSGSGITTVRLIGSTPYNRFHGVVVTQPTGWDSFGMLDEPDDGDYQAALDSHLVAYPIYPNPTTPGGYLTFRFRLYNHSFVRLRVHRTPNSVIFGEADEYSFWDPSIYEYDPGTSVFGPGQYRIYISSRAPGKPEFVSYGDFIISK